MASSDAQQSQFLAAMERELLESFAATTTSDKDEVASGGAAAGSGGGDAGGGGGGNSQLQQQQQQQDQKQNPRADSFDFSVASSTVSAAKMRMEQHQQHQRLEGFDEEGEEANEGESGGGGGPPQLQQQRSNPVLIPKSQQQQLSQQSQQQQSSSYGSSASSAFVNSVLNPSGAGGGGVGSFASSTFNATQLSHTPPTAIANSYEASHFGKRMRSGSVSGRLRSASEYLEDKGLLDRQTKSLMKDLIIIGDEELQEALDLYETAGDASALEQMISSGELQQRMPTDLDLMNDLDLDFLTVHDNNSNSNLGGGDVDIAPGGDMKELPPAAAASGGGGGEHHHQQHPQQQKQQAGAAAGGVPNPLSARPKLPSHQQLMPNHSNKQPRDAGASGGSTNRQPNQPTMVSPQYDDGIGDLDFNDLVGGGAGHHDDEDPGDNNPHHNNTVDYLPHQDQQRLRHQQQNHNQHQQVFQHAPGKQAAFGGGGESGTSPATASTMSDYERRMRSNSLFSALLSVGESQMTQQQQRNREDSFSLPGGGGGAGPVGSAAGIAAHANSKGNPHQQLPGGVVADQKKAAASTAADGLSNNDWMEQYLEPIPSTTESAMEGIEISKPKAKSKQRSSLQANAGGTGGIGASLLESETPAAEGKPTKRKYTKKQGKKDKQGKGSSKEEKASAKADSNDEKEEHIPGSGRPRSLSDPNLVNTKDEFGLRHVDRPDGWVGAYSPDSRKVRIAKFLEKRNHRVWSKTIKYDVRKNFADSRLRVKGRFVRKEDELLMRELMSLT